MPVQPPTPKPPAPATPRVAAPPAPVAPQAPAPAAQLAPTRPTVPPKPLLGGAERRHSQRVILVIPVEVTWAGEAGLHVKEHATTEVVSQHGALLKMKTCLPVGTEIELTRPKIRQTSKARVVGIAPPAVDGMARNSVELALPSEAFWGVVIPKLNPTG